jgi:hypothetical protein
MIELLTWPVFMCFNCVYVCSALWFQGWTGEASISDAIVEMACRLPHCKMFITTRGTQGSVLLERGAVQQVGELEGFARAYLGVERALPGFTSLGIERALLGHTWGLRGLCQGLPHWGLTGLC